MERAALPGLRGLGHTIASSGRLLLQPPNPLKILVVEDEPLIRMDLAATLREMEFVVYEAPNADDAIRLLEADEDIAAVVTDVDVPGTMDGLALAFAIRRRWPPCRLIVVSARRRPAAGDMPDGSRFMRKPLATPELARTLSDLGLR